MLFLLSNDDGIEAAGIRLLAAEIARVGEVWLVAPDRERSATSHAISLHKPLRIRQLNEREFAVDGTPTDCVYLGLHHLMPAKPEVVVSGINLGANLGNDVLYSGTVAAAMEAALFGYPAIAVSLCVGDNSVEQAVLEAALGRAATVAARLAVEVARRPMPSGVVINVNVPMEEPAGIKLCRLGYTDYAEAVAVREDPRGKPYYWIGGERTGHDGIADSDNNGIAAGFVTVTPIHYDLTDHRSFDYVRSLRVDLEKRNDSLGDGPLGYPIHPRKK